MPAAQDGLAAIVDGQAHGGTHREWIGRLRPDGWLVLIEARWCQVGKSSTPYGADADELPWNGGVGADELAAAVRPLVVDLHVESLSGDLSLWGGPVADERYALLAQI